MSMTEYASQWLQSFVTDEGEIAALNALCASLGVKPLPVYNKADFANLNAVYAANSRCDKCFSQGKSSCFKYSLELVNGHYKAEKKICNVNLAFKFISNSGIPERYAGCRIEDFSINEYNRRAVDCAKSAINHNKGFFVYGAVGVGKTMLSSIVVIERAFLGKSTLFYTVTDMFKDLRDFDNPVSRAEKERAVKSVAGLVIDDLGAEYVTDWSGAKLFEILDHRFKSGGCTVINSNFLIGDIAKRYGDVNGLRIARRIKELCTLTDILG